MANTEAKAPKERSGKHEYIAATSGEAVDIEAATGNRYTSIDTGKTSEYVLAGGKPGKPLTMLAVRGLRTEMTNEASAARQRGDDEIEAINARLGNLVDGQWDVASERKGPTLKYAEFGAAVGRVKGLDAAGIAERVAKAEADPTWARAVLRDIPEIAQAYRELTGNKREALTLDAI